MSSTTTSAHRHWGTCTGASNRLLAQALDTTIDTDSDRLWLFRALAPTLPPSLLAQALDTASTIPDDDYRTMSLEALAPYLPADLLDLALDTGP
jgi:hypothetical protein